jgi:hypothetical protein
MYTECGSFGCVFNTDPLITIGEIDYWSSFNTGIGSIIAIRIDKKLGEGWGDLCKQISIAQS